MKLWEVLKAYDEDRKKRFSCESAEVMNYRGEDEFMWIGTTIIPTSLLNSDWHEVKQPVTWQEAIQAWANSKKVVWEDDEERHVFDRKNGRFSPKHGTQMIDQDGDAVTVRMISGGKWYVEERQ